MIRIKLFGLFIAFALLALVRPRKCMELLEAADRGVAKPAGNMEGFEKHFAPDAMAGWDFTRTKNGVAYKHVPTNCAYTGWLAASADECPLPPASWRCTRRAGHDGPCAAVEV